MSQELEQGQILKQWAALFGGGNFKKGQHSGCGTVTIHWYYPYLKQERTVSGDKGIKYVQSGQERLNL